MGKNDKASKKVDHIRIYDQILRSAHSQKLPCDELLACTVINADNVVEYMLTDYKDNWELSEFPNLNPPFRDFFIDFKFPDVIRLSNGNEIKHTGIKSGGIHLVAWNRDDFWQLTREVDRKPLYKIIPQFAEWIYSATFHIAKDKNANNPGTLVCMGLIAVDETGKYRDQTPMVYIPINDDAQTQHDIMHRFREDAGYANGLISYSLMCISLMNCRNVELVDRSQVKSSHIKNIKWSLPPYTYKVLKVHTTRKVYQNSKTESNNADIDPKRLHIVRGNFATYTEDAPLFGKYTGTFWRPAHVRGDEEQGIVIKDYDVQAPE